MNSQKFESISINGRIAFAISCLEKVLDEENIKNHLLIKNIDYFWEFVSSDSLDIWDDQVSSFPTNLNDFIERYHLKNHKSDKVIIIFELFDLIIDIGRANLYGAFQSELTLKQLDKIIEIMTVNSYKLPNLLFFQKSKVTDYHGWGHRVSPAYFKCL
ncbi:hypothetical protein SAMN04488559_101217 [Isobaculum melis]|uniref:Uncharacterized protein n=1 Tax=Isobaculum melis TaxID=142588 RepID=A0A1H9PXM6_9LACT|nr:hypothetical protein SAMN04488559_101217 [Isobaculum melis]